MLACVLAAVWVVAVALPAVAQNGGAVQGNAAVRLGGSVETLPVEELKAGMLGVGYTVVQGSEPQEFQVELLGVLQNVLPKQDIVFARLSGLELDKHGVVSGMSGSPVYIDGKLIGAIAYRWMDFQTEAVAGITPIDNMLRMAQLESDGEANFTGLRDGELLLTAAADLLAGRPTAGALASLRPAATSGVARIATPVTLGGFHPRVVARLSPWFDALGWHPVLGGGLSSRQQLPPLRPGSAVAAHLMHGDIALTATGSVTHVDGDRVLAFGHPFLQGGSVDFPMAPAEVLTVLGSLSASLKLTAAGGEVIGAIRQDRQTGILGIVGAQPRTIPVQLVIDGGRGVSEAFHFEMASDKLLSPVLLFLGLANGLQSVDKAFGDSALEISGEFALAGGLPSVRLRNLFSSDNQAFVSVSATVAAIFNFLYDNAFGPVRVERIDLDVRVRDDRKVAQISRVWYDRSEVRPGDVVNLTVWLKPYRESEVAKEIAIRIPEDVGRGPLTLLVGDAGAVSREEQSFIQGEFTPRSLEHLVRLLNNIRTNDRIYVQATREDEGALVRGEPMPSLPLSVLEILSAGQTSGEVIRLSKSVILEEETPVEYVVSGQHRIQLRVRRP